MRQNPEYEILFYETPDGKCFVDQFLDKCPLQTRAKIEKWMELLEIHGPSLPLPRPYADNLRDKIRELRIKFAGFQYRILYFFTGKKIIMTHGFIKKTAEVPEEEIFRAIRLMKDFGRRLKEGDIQL